MQVITYDPEKGHCVSDAQVLEFSKKILDNKRDFTVGSEIIINQIRNLIKTRYNNNITNEDIRFEFRSKKIHIDENGHLDYWPLGFCDYSDRLLVSLLTNQ